MSRATSGSRRTRLLGLALLAATFAAGALAGTAFDRLLAARPVTELRAVPPVAVPAASAATGQPERKGDLFDELSLSLEQRSRIDAVLGRRRDEVEAFWNHEGARLRGIVDSARSEIRSQLSPAQQAEYDRLRAERKKNDASCPRPEAKAGSSV